MKNEHYLKLRDRVSEMNKINDEISLIKWNNEDGPKFSSIEEMKEFENRLKNNEFDYLFGNDDNAIILDTIDIIVESYSHKLDNILFHIYTYQNKSNLNYITYMTLTNVNDNNIIDNLCGNSTSNKESAHNYFEILKETITNNNINDILENLIIGAEATIISLKNTLSNLTSKC